MNNIPKHFGLLKSWDLGCQHGEESLVPGDLAALLGGQL